MHVRNTSNEIDERLKKIESKIEKNKNKEITKGPKLLYKTYNKWN